VQRIDELIAAAPVFEGLSSEQLALIAGCAHNEHRPGGAMLFHEGEPADRFFLIRRGSVAAEIHAPGRGALVIETLQAGDPVGLSWLFPPYRWQLDARAVGPCELVVFDGACLRGKCEEDHELGYQLMRRFAANVASRFQATRLQLLDVYGHA
jgi:CRP/FNR family transcriptional regulator, cyclic AMP receptor protein